MSGSNVAASSAHMAASRADEAQCSTAIKVGNCKATRLSPLPRYSPCLFAQVDVFISGQQAIRDARPLQTNADSPSGQQRVLRDAAGRTIRSEPPEQ